MNYNATINFSFLLWTSIYSHSGQIYTHSLHSIYTSTHSLTTDYICICSINNQYMCTHSLNADHAKTNFKKKGTRCGVKSGNISTNRIWGKLINWAHCIYIYIYIYIYHINTHTQTQTPRNRISLQHSTHKSHQLSSHDLISLALAISPTRRKRNTNPSASRPHKDGNDATSPSFSEC